MVITAERQRASIFTRHIEHVWGNMHWHDSLEASADGCTTCLNGDQQGPGQLGEWSRDRPGPSLIRAAN